MIEDENRYVKGQIESNRIRAEARILEWYKTTSPGGDGAPPATVYVVGLGRTLPDYIRWTMEREPPHDENHAVWTVNRGMHSLRHDLLFVLDDLPGERAQFPLYGAALETHPNPFVTTTEYPEFPNALAYPFTDMVAFYGDVTLAGYLHNSIPYMLALCPPLGVKRVVLWGCDYVRPDGTVDEYGLANVEYWCGVLRANGLEVGSPTTSTLLGGQREQGHIYGWPHKRLPARIMEQIKMFTKDSDE